MTVSTKTTNAEPSASGKVARPFLKWVGGKGRLLPQYQVLFPTSYNKYFEPFVGGGAVFFSLNPTRAHINDSNHVLTSAYTNIRDNAGSIIDSLRRLEKKYQALRDAEAQKNFFYEIRERFNKLDDDNPEKTELLIFLNRTCFNGLYRENSKGHFNVPFGKYANPTICDADNLRTISAALQKTVITSGSFEHAIKTAEGGDFVYFDPPYHPLNATSSFTSYHEGGFTEQDQIKLRDTFKRLADKGVLVMLSNSNTPFIKEIYKEFKIHTVYAGRAINSVGSKRGKIEELVITNY